MLAGWTVVDFPSSTYLDGMGIASTSGLVTLWVDDLKKILGGQRLVGRRAQRGHRTATAGRPDHDADYRRRAITEADRGGRAPVRRSVQLRLNSCGPRLPAGDTVRLWPTAGLLARCPLPSDVPDVAGQDLFDALAVAGGEVIHDGVVLGG